jgi:phosphoglycerate dehydrogenase-like enzyme
VNSAGVPVWIEAEADRRPQLEEAVRLGGGVVAPPHRARAVVWMADRPHDLQALLHPGVEWVQLSSAGIEAWFVAGVIDEERAWTAATGVYARPIAEYVVGMLLAAARRLPDVVRARGWQPLDVRALSEATVGIVGAGGIGTAVIDLLQPFGARTIALTRTGRAVAGADLSVGPAELDMVVEASDFLVLALPETPETRGLIDASRLARMRPDAWLVNVGRGTAVDTQALVAELKRGRLGGAALDVTDPEPLPDEHPLWALPNVVITSHTANTQRLGAQALAARVQENVRRFGNGEPLLGLIELRRGY